jgi:SAM-dependent methyltransferase
MSQVEYGPLAQYYELINESCVPYDDQAAFVLALAEEFLPSRSRPRVLDVACGPGLLSKRLIRCDLEVVGIDLAEALLTQTAARGRGRCACADMRNLPFGECFDLACCLLHTINYMTRDEDLGLALSSIAGSLVPGGVAAVDFIAYSPPSEWQAAWRETIRTSKVEIICEHYQTPDWGTMVAVDRHVYTVREPDRTWSVSGEDHLRITSADELRTFTERAGLEPIVVCGKYDLNAGLGFDGGVVVARKPAG